MSEPEKYDISDPEQKAKLRKKIGQDINVNINDESGERMLEKLDEISEKLGDKDVHTSDDLSERKIKFFNDYKDQRILDATSNEELRDVMKSIVQLGLEKAKGTPAGSASLEGQFSEQEKGTSYGSYKELVDDLMERRDNGDEDAKRILDVYMAKVARALKSNDPQLAQMNKVFDPNSPEAIEEFKKHLHQEGAFLVPDRGWGMLDRYKNGSARRAREIRKAKGEQ